MSQPDDNVIQVEYEALLAVAKREWKTPNWNELAEGQSERQKMFQISDRERNDLFDVALIAVHGKDAVSNTITVKLE